MPSRRLLLAALACLSAEPAASAAAAFVVPAPSSQAKACRGSSCAPPRSVVISGGGGGGRGDGEHDDAAVEGDDARGLSRVSSEVPAGRRSFLASLAAGAAVSALSVSLPAAQPAAAAEEAARSTADAVVTDKIFIQFKGLPTAAEEGGDAAAAAPSSSSRIVVGLFGNDAPQPVSLLKRLVGPGGLPTKCKPLDTSRLLQREQLEANKVYNSCKENEDSIGVNYDYATVWRVDRDRRIDVGAVSGRFVARENPNFEDGVLGAVGGSGLTHDRPGVVSVRRGSDGGFGFTIFPGGGKGGDLLDEDNIVVGRVVEGMDVVRRLNELPVIQSSNVNYMGLTGGPTAKNAPSRACRYGGPMYCNELKPLKKTLIEKTGVLP